MTKYAITITYDQDGFFSQDYLDDDYLRESVVIIGERGYEICADADWWKDANDIITDIGYDIDEPFDDYMENNSSLCAEDKLKDIYDVYHDNNWDTDDMEFIAKVAEILYPFLHLEVDSISGYHEYADVIYEQGAVDIDDLEDWVFGNIFLVDAYELDTAAMEEDGVAMDDLSIDDVQEYGTSVEGTYPITETYYYHNHREPDFISKLASNFGLPAEDCIIVEAD